MKYILVLFAAFLFCPVLVFAQADSTRVQYTEENAASSDFSLKETYKYVIRAQVEEKSLFKIGVHGFGFSHSGGFLRYGIGFEQKIKPSFSVLGDFVHTLEHDDPLKENPKFAFNLGARYYYNIEKRIRKGKSANNFSANYLGIYQQNMLVKENENYHYQTNVNFLYGLQRRLGKYGYVDFGFGPALKHADQKTRLSFNALFSIGLAF
jgi:hypothetical protein